MNALEAFRQQHQLSYRGLARVLGDSANGFSKSAVHRICTGHSNPTLQQEERIKAVIKAFNAAIQLKGSAILIVPTGKAFEVEFINSEGKHLKHLTIQG